MKIFSISNLFTINPRLLSVYMMLLSLFASVQLSSASPDASANLTAVEKSASPHSPPAEQPEGIVAGTQQTASPTSEPTPTPNPSDLISGRNWKYMPGVTHDGTGLSVSYLGRSIVEQDGSGGVANPAINLYGPRLDAKGNFKVTTTLHKISGNMVISLFGAPPRVYDEFLFMEPTVQFAIDEENLNVTFWNGSNEDPSLTKRYAVENSANYDLRIERMDGKLFYQVNGIALGSTTDGGVFKTGQVWFGLETTTPQGNFVVEKLTAESLTGGSVTIVDVPSTVTTETLDPQSFQQLAKAHYPNKTIGAAIALGPLVSDASYKKLALGGWYGVFTTENALKAQFVHPQPSIYSFQEADAIVDIAAKNAISIHGHALVFGEANARWMQQTAGSQLETVMQDHITTIVSRYSGKIATWDVVNEPLADDYWDGKLKLRDHIWHKAMGKSYIEKAFSTAKAADPTALLFINEWGLEEESDRWTGMLSLVEELLQKGVPIDGIGFQAHVYERGDAVNANTLRAHFRQVDALGKKYNKSLKVRISEMDVYGHNSVQQAEQFAQTLKVCMEEPNCISFSMWGITEKYGSTSWIDDDGRLYIGDGLPFSETLEPLGAVSAMQSILSGTATPTPTPKIRRNRSSSRNR